MPSYECRKKVRNHPQQRSMKMYKNIWILCVGAFLYMSLPLQSSHAKCTLKVKVSNGFKTPITLKKITTSWGGIGYKTRWTGSKKVKKGSSTYFTLSLTGGTTCAESSWYIKIFRSNGEHHICKKVRNSANSLFLRQNGFCSISSK